MSRMTASSPEEVVEKIRTYLLREDTKKIIVLDKEGKEVVYVKQPSVESSLEARKLNNSEKFKDVFGLRVTEVWAMSNGDFGKWMSARYEEPKPEQSKIIRCKDCRYSEYDFIFHSRYCHNKGKAEIVGDNFFCAAGRYMTNGSD